MVSLYRKKKSGHFPNPFIIIFYWKQNGKLPFSKFDYVISWLYRETICYYLFFQATIDPTVQWRNGTYRLKWGGLAEEINTTDKDLKKTSTTLTLPTQIPNGTTNANSNNIIKPQPHSSSKFTLIQQIPSSTSSMLPSTQQSNSLILNIWLLDGDEKSRRSLKQQYFALGFLFLIL